MPKLLIIDGSSMLSTSYYGNLPKSILFAKTEEEKEKHYGQILHTSDGKYTNAMFTMLRTLLGIYKKVKPEYVAFVFDKTRDTFRRTELGADFYKANRKETAKPLKEQFVQMEEFLQEIGCAVFMSDDYEADDYAASLVEKFEGPDLQTYVLTKDHDYIFNLDDVRIPYLTKGDKRLAEGGGRNPTDVWYFDRVNNMTKKKLNLSHPTVYPLSMIVRIVKMATNPGDTVLDPFAGSGTSLVAAKIMGRNGIGFE